MEQEAGQQDARWGRQHLTRSDGGAAVAASAQASAQAGPSSEQLLWDDLRQKDAQILVLQKKLAHLRSWVASVHAKVQQVNPQAIKNSKRLYVGNLPQDATEDELKQFLHTLMLKTGALASPGTAILSCKITPEKSYAFVEFRSVEETSNAMAFDGVAFRDTFLKVRRPSNYDLATAIMLGPISPDPTMDTSQLEICRTVVEDSPHKLFVGGLPCEWTEDMVKELLLPYGALKSFNLVMDKTTGKSKGYAFCEFQDESTADLIIKNLNLRRVGNKALTVKRALEGSKQSQQQLQSTGSGGSPVAPGMPLTPAGAGPGLPKMTTTPLSASPGQHGGPGGHGTDSPSGLQGAFAAFLQQHGAVAVHGLMRGHHAHSSPASALSGQELGGITPEQLAAAGLGQPGPQGVPPFALQGLGFW